MTIKMSRQLIINDNIKWLELNTLDCLEQDHIIVVLKDPINQYYKNSILMICKWDKQCSMSCLGCVEKQCFDPNI